MWIKHLYIYLLFFRTRLAAECSHFRLNCFHVFVECTFSPYPFHLSIIRKWNVAGVCFSVMPKLFIFAYKKQSLCVCLCVCVAIQDKFHCALFQQRQCTQFPWFIRLIGPLSIQRHLYYDGKANELLFLNVNLIFCFWCKTENCASNRIDNVRIWYSELWIFSTMHLHAGECSTWMHPI